MELVMDHAALTSPPVGELIASAETVDPGERVAQVADRFIAAPHLEAMTVLSDDGVLGLVTRGKLFQLLFHRFGMELFGKDAISDVADRHPLIVDAREPLDEVLRQAMERRFEDIYDEIVVIGEDGRFLGLLSVKHLVVEQGNVLAQSLVHREVALTREQEMKRLSEVKGQFITHVTHELRSPVNAILGLTELMQMSLTAGRVEPLQEKLVLMNASATSLRAIITNILDLSKIESGRMEVYNETFDLAPLLQEVVDTTRILLGERPVTVRHDCHPLVIVSDAVKLRQILVNLTSNAAKFTEKGEIVVRAAATPDGLQITVSDSGIGIRQEDLDRLFVAFSQIEDAKTRRFEGTGIGLTITRQLTQLLGGHVEVTSIYGEGSTFAVHFPPTTSFPERPLHDQA
ncbi:MAG: hypothetical protein A2005_05445 [Desulfuromonadales bacterium GWC2_61_20]|nr:MAG: hypothetical protein A2005_05445 [Desulfuromonadales bacterium GWC2_61_20]HAD03770.1 histidine kinase [Desulfuromonas sp.]